jgi:disulfide bond formation protein DsbB
MRVEIILLAANVLKHINKASRHTIKDMTEERSQSTQQWNILFTTWLVALVSTLAALFIGEIMGQTPCVLCWYQRIFMFPLAIILGVALYRGNTAVSAYALPLAAGGWLVAAFHVLLYFKMIPEDIKPCGTSGSCTDAQMTIFGGVPLPLLALIAFTIIFVLLTLLQRKRLP